MHHLHMVIVATIKPKLRERGI